MIINGVDINNYVGLPYVEYGSTKAGCDCYGLLSLLYKDVLGKILPDYSTVIHKPELINTAFLNEQAKWIEISKPGQCNAVCFRIGGLVRHVGMMLNEKLFIHAWRGADSCIENINDIIWRHRVDGFFWRAD